MSETLRSCECKTEEKATISSLYYILSQTKTFKGRNTVGDVSLQQVERKNHSFCTGQATSCCNRSRPQRHVAPTNRLVRRNVPHKIKTVWVCAACHDDKLETCRLTRKQRFSQKNLQYEAISLLRHFPATCRLEYWRTLKRRALSCPLSIMFVFSSL